MPKSEIQWGYFVPAPPAMSAGCLYRVLGSASLFALYTVALALLQSFQLLLTSHLALPFGGGASRCWPFAVRFLHQPRVSYRRCLFGNRGLVAPVMSSPDRTPSQTSFPTMNHGSPALSPPLPRRLMSCIACRDAKVRCDGTSHRQACDRCARKRLHCVRNASKRTPMGKGQLSRANGRPPVPRRPHDSREWHLLAGWITKTKKDALVVR